MQRLTSALVLGGGVLLISYINAPAAPTPAPLRATAAEVAAIEALAPWAEEITQETERLRARLAVTPAPPVARRDPFSFGAPRSVEPAITPKRVVERETPEEMALPPAIAWPSLVAVLTTEGAAGARTAVLGVGERIEMLKAGETVGGFLVRVVEASSVELVHVASATATRLSLR